MDPYQAGQMPCQSCEAFSDLQDTTLFYLLSIWPLLSELRQLYTALWLHLMYMAVIKG